MKDAVKQFLKKIPFAENFRDILLRSRKQTSYSQCGEDLIARFFLPKKKEGFYVDIGSNDPKYLNNTYFFYKLGWAGICVEPNLRRCRQLKRTRPRDAVLNFGAGPAKGKMDYFRFDPDTISTFSSKEAGEFQKLGHKLVGVEKVPVLPLSEILGGYGQGEKIDLLSIDTEGLDLDILKSNDWNKFRPTLVIAETAEYRKQDMIRASSGLDGYLLSQDYIKLADTYINGIYMEGKYARSSNLINIY